MEAETKAAAPGLRWRDGKPAWRASKTAIAAGYPVKNVNLSALASDPEALYVRCHRLQAEMLEWTGKLRSPHSGYDGTIGSLLRFYQTDPESPYFKLKSSSLKPYNIYTRMLDAEIGKRRIDACDGRDVTRWFTTWSAPEGAGRPRLPRARFAIAVLKAAVSFGIMCRRAGCPEFKAILDEMSFAQSPHRSHAPGADVVIRARAAATKLGHAPAAFAYAIQFETTLRQWDVIGEWIPLSDPRPSAVISGNQKWIGPTWAQVDESLVLRVTPSKTQATSGMRVVLDLRTYPMVMEELSHVPSDRRKGPLIVNPNTGLPYRHATFGLLWRQVVKAAELPIGLWNRDLRAGGITEARQSGAQTDDVAKQAGHSTTRPTAEVYDRDSIEAARRVAKARVLRRAHGLTHAPRKGE